MRSVVLFNHTKSQFGVLGSIVQSLAAAFERLGIEAHIRELEEMTPEVLVPIVQELMPDCTWSINTILDEGWFYYPLGIPHVDLSVDMVTYSHPASFSRPHLISLFVDKTSCDLFARRSETPVYWFPHGIAKEQIDRVRGLSSIPIQDRLYDVVLIGSFIDHDHEKWAWSQIFSAADVELFVAIAQKALDDPTFFFPIHGLACVEDSKSVRNSLEKAGLSSFFLINSIERYARGLDRERLLFALKDRNVHIFASEKDAVGWSSRPSAKGCIFHPPVPFDNVFDICRNAKVVVNSVPTIRQGYHERLFLALASGAVTLTSEGGLLPRSLINEGRVVEYKSSALGTLRDDLKCAEGRPYDAAKMLAWLEAEHSWDARLKRGLPEIEKSVTHLHDVWDSNPFWRLGCSLS